LALQPQVLQVTQEQVPLVALVPQPLVRAPLVSVREQELLPPEGEPLV
jgi:hypothetical protein